MTVHDQIHKEFFKYLLPEFLEEFAPELASEVDFTTLTFIDYSFGDADEGSQRHVDILARFELLNPPAGEENVPRYVLVHVEHQARPQVIFPQRMLEYFMKIWLKHKDAIIYPIALYTHDAFREEKDWFEIRAFGKEILRFQFTAIQLRRFDWREYADSRNPAIIALIANMGRDSEDRPKRKSTAYRLANELCKEGRAENEVHLVLSYVDTYLDLSPAENLQFEEEIRTLELESEPIMKLQTTREKIAREEGREEGREVGLEEGREEGMLRLLSLQLDRHEIRLSKSQRQRFESLDCEQLEQAAQQLVDSPTTFVDWLIDLGR